MSLPYLKLLFSIDSLQAGGAEKSTLDLVYQLAKNWEITVVYFYGKHDLKEAFEAAPCKLVYIPLESGYKFKQGVKAIINLVQKEKIDLIVTTLYRSGIMCRIAGRRSKIPVVDTIVNDSYSVSKLNEFKGPNKLKFYSVKYLDKLTAGIPTKWISNSAAIASTMGRSLGLKPAKVKVIYRGRDTNQMPAWSSPGLQKGFHFVAAGRLVAQKGFMDLIHAFSKLHRRSSTSKLTIFGEGPDRFHLEKTVEDLQLSDSVQLPGRVPNVWQQFYNAHCFVLPSHYEGLSGVLIEALITGIPIIASDIPMNTEAAVSDHSINFFKMGDIDDLHTKMQLMYDDYETLSIHSKDTRNKAIERYDLAGIATQYNRELEEVLQRN